MEIETAEQALEALHEGITVDITGTEETHPKLESWSGTFEVSKRAVGHIKRCCDRLVADGVEEASREDVREVAVTLAEYEYGAQIGLEFATAADGLQAVSYAEQFDGDVEV